MDEPQHPTQHSAPLVPSLLEDSCELPNQESIEEFIPFMITTICAYHSNLALESWMLRGVGRQNRTRYSAPDTGL